MNGNLFLVSTLLTFAIGLASLASPDVSTQSIMERVYSTEDHRARLDTLEHYIRDWTYTHPAEARTLIATYHTMVSDPSLTVFSIKADYLLARFHLVRTNYDSLDLLLQRAIPLARQKADPSLLCDFIKIKGLRHYYLGEFAKGIQVFVKNIDLAKAAGEVQMAAYYNNIGICYEKLQDYDAALKYYHLALDIDRRLPDNQYGIHAMINNISVIHLNRKDWQASYTLLQAICDTMTGPGPNNLHLDLAHAYARALFGLGKADQAMAVHQAALDLALEVEDPQRIILHYLGLGDRHKDMTQYVQAISYYQHALEYMESNALQEQRAAIYLSLSHCHKQVGNFEDALQYTELLSQTRDGIYEEKDIALARELDEKYQSSLKDQALLESKLKLAQRKRRNNVLSLVLAGILVTGFFMYQNQEKSKQLDQQELLLAEQHIADLEQQQKITHMSSMIEGQEAERHRIAKDLHDGLGGLLTTVKTKVAQIQKTVDELEDLDLYQSTSDMIDQACDEVRRISSNMIPGLLRIEGLQGAVEELMGQWQFVHGLQVDATIDFDASQLSEVQTHMLYRIVQEAANNVIKHSKASEIVLQLIEYEDHLNLLLEDNGIGFDPKQVQAGLGLQSIRSRVHFLNGDLDINSSKKGTSLSISIPT